MRALLLILVLALFLPVATHAETWRDPDLGEQIHQGAADNRFIWLKGRSRALVRFDRATGERTVLATDALDLLVDGSHVWLLSGLADSGPLTIRDLRAPEVSVTFDTLMRSARLIPGDDFPALLTLSRVFRYEDGEWRTTAFAGSLDQRGFGIGATDASGALYVGLSRGEWGGGLRRVGLDGSIAFIAQREPGCGGLLNPDCEPVVGLFRDRSASDCMIAGTGLSHMGLTLGRVYRVCGQSISVVYETPAGLDSGPFPNRGWAMDSLVKTRDGWVGLNARRYALNRDGAVVEKTVPTLEEWSGLKISRETDGLLFLMSSCCWGSATRPLHGVMALPVIE